MDLLKIIRLLTVFLLTGFMLGAHPMPHSVLLLDVQQDGITAELQWPLKELQFVFPQERIDTDVATLLQRKGADLQAYLLQHMHVQDAAGHAWKITVVDAGITTDEQAYTGKYNELTFRLLLQPPPGASTRHFTIVYDAIMHQLITHKMFIRIRQDWDGGLSGKDSTDAELGVLMINPSTNTAPAVIVNLDEGNRWKGFKSMISLGIRHISEGTDHLLFLLVLMLPAPLLVHNKRWAGSGGSRYAVIRLLKIATAFTIGHSFTLLAGTAGWLRLPSQPVEVAIAVSILIGSLHALRPLFPNKEMLIAGGFGLVHGLAFSATLTSLHLDGARMALSILGFNLGIELMQLFVIILFVPWLIVLSQYGFYRWIRITGALFALVAAVAWIAERTLQVPNRVGMVVQDIALHGQWIVLLLAIATLIAYIVSGKRANR